MPSLQEQEIEAQKVQNTVYMLSHYNTSKLALQFKAIRGPLSTTTTEKMQTVEDSLRDLATTANSPLLNPEARLFYGSQVDTIHKKFMAPTQEIENPSSPQANSLTPSQLPIVPVAPTPTNPPSGLITCTRPLEAKLRNILFHWISPSANQLLLMQDVESLLHSYTTQQLSISFLHLLNEAQYSITPTLIMATLAEWTQLSFDDETKKILKKLLAETSKNKSLFQKKHEKWKKIAIFSAIAVVLVAGIILYLKYRENEANISLLKISTEALTEARKQSALDKARIAELEAQVLRLKAQITAYQNFFVLHGLWQPKCNIVFEEKIAADGFMMLIIEVSDVSQDSTLEVSAPVGLTIQMANEKKFAQFGCMSLTPTSKEKIVISGQAPHNNKQAIITIIIRSDIYTSCYVQSVIISAAP